MSPGLAGKSGKEAILLLYDQIIEPAHILIIDDQPSNVLILREAVRGLGEIHFATSGEAALQAA